jgi:hypothetical protein
MTSIIGTLIWGSSSEGVTRWRRRRAAGTPTIDAAASAWSRGRPADAPGEPELAAGHLEPQRLAVRLLELLGRRPRPPPRRRGGRISRPLSSRRPPGGCRRPPGRQVDEDHELTRVEARQDLDPASLERAGGHRPGAGGPVRRRGPPPARAAPRWWTAARRHQMRSMATSPGIRARPLRPDGHARGAQADLDGEGVGGGVGGGDDLAHPAARMDPRSGRASRVTGSCLRPRAVAGRGRGRRARSAAGRGTPPRPGAGRGRRCRRPRPGCRPRGGEGRTDHGLGGHRGRRSGPPPGLLDRAPGLLELHPRHVELELGAAPSACSARKRWKLRSARARAALAWARAPWPGTADPRSPRAGSRAAADRRSEAPALTRTATTGPVTRLETKARRAGWTVPRTSMGLTPRRLVSTVVTAVATGASSALGDVGRSWPPQAQRASGT